MESRAVFQQRLKNVVLIILSLIFLPVNTFVLVCASLSNKIFKSEVELQRDQIRSHAGFKPKTILVTGVGMSKGLALARSFYLAGHNVIGANCDPFACGRVSKSLTKFFVLRKPTSRYGSSAYIEDLLSIIRKEGVDLWCSCSDVASAMDDAEAREVIEAKTSCKAVQFDVETIKRLHEKHNFIESTKSLGLTVPETHTIINRADAEEKLREAPAGRHFIMKPIGVDDANRGNMTLLPLDTKQKTKAHLERLEISKAKPWILQQYIDGPEYCTHSLIINGQIKAFTACKSAELLMHYVALPEISQLYQAMLDFTQTYVANEGVGFSGHLSFDFMIENTARTQDDEKNAAPILYPIECNPRVHTAVVLFNQTPGLSDAYLSLLEPTSGHANGNTNSIVTPAKTDKYFWVGHDLTELVLYPFYAFMTAQAHGPIRNPLSGLLTFTERLLTWHDGTFERWDPVPFWALYHIYWPVKFWNALKTGQPWSRINVSTTKMFGC